MDRWPHSQCGDTGSNPVGVIRAASAAKNNGTWLSWSERLSDMQESGGSIPPVPTITGGSSTGEFKKQNPVWDFGSSNRFIQCSKHRDVGSNPTHRAMGHKQQFLP